ncbi:MAG: hypothetical protein WAQ22_01245 [Candidatus Saccharimonas sp.]
MDFLRSHKHRSRLNEALYIALNIGLAALLFSIVLVVQSPWLAFILVILSKWRALAVRPRFWIANLIANTVDLNVGMSVVVLLYAASGTVWLQAIIAILYAAWLLFIKPRSSKKYVAMQAGISVFIGITALSIISYNWNPLFFVAIVWAIGYSAARHVLGSYDEPMTKAYSLIVGVVYAELGWVSYHWLFAYSLPGLGVIKLTQLALFLVLIGLILERAYASYHHNEIVKWNDVFLPIMVTVSLVFIILIFFNDLSVTGLI